MRSRRRTIGDIILKGYNPCIAKTGNYTGMSENFSDRCYWYSKIVPTGQINTP